MEALHTVFSIIVSIIMMGIFVSALKKIWHGYNGWRSGEQDFSELLAGLLMIITPLIVYGVFSMFGMGDAAISPTDIKALNEYR